YRGRAAELLPLARRAQSCFVVADTVVRYCAREGGDRYAEPFPPLAELTALGLDQVGHFVGSAPHRREEEVRVRCENSAGRFHHRLQLLVQRGGGADLAEIGQPVH